MFPTGHVYVSQENINIMSPFFISLASDNFNSIHKNQKQMATEDKAMFHAGKKQRIEQQL